MKYAQNTEVAVSRSRGDIDSLLRQWGCAAISWSDNFAMGWAQLSFAWKRNEDVYLAKFRIAIPAEKALRKEAADLAGKRYARKSPERIFDELRARVGKREHRVLFLWIKAALNAVDEGIIPAEALFLPFLVGSDGRTFAEVALPRLPMLLKGAADSLLIGDGS